MFDSKFFIASIENIIIFKLVSYNVMIQWFWMKLLWVLKNGGDWVLISPENATRRAEHWPWILKRTTCFYRKVDYIELWTTMSMWFRTEVIIYLEIRYNMYSKCESNKSAYNIIGIIYYLKKCICILYYIILVN